LAILNKLRTNGGALSTLFLIHNAFSDFSKDKCAQNNDCA